MNCTKPIPRSLLILVRSYRIDLGAGLTQFMISQLGAYFIFTFGPIFGPIFGTFFGPFGPFVPFGSIVDDPISCPIFVQICFGSRFGPSFVHE